MLRCPTLAVSLGGKAGPVFYCLHKHSIVMSHRTLTIQFDLNSCCIDFRGQAGSVFKHLREDFMTDVVSIVDGLLDDGAVHIPPPYTCVSHFV